MTTGVGRPALVGAAAAGACPRATWAKISFTTLSLGAFVAFLLLPTYPIYDSEYYLFWGREILHGQLPTFTIFDAPTEHPLAIGFGTVLSIFGNAALRLEVLCAIASFLLIAGGLYRLTRTAFTPLVAAVAVLLLLTRFNFEFLAARGYVDATYAAAIVWAAALEVERPRRGTRGLPAAARGGADPAGRVAARRALLAVVRARMDWRGRIRWALVVRAAPIAWVAARLGRDRPAALLAPSNAGRGGRARPHVPLGQLPGTTWHYLVVLVKAPVLGGAVAGLMLSAWLVPRRMIAPVVILACGIGTFLVLAGAGLSVIDRYLLMPSVIVLVFCAFALSGWTMLDRGWLRRIWAICAVGLATFGIYDVASTLSVNKIATELGFRDDSHTSLVAILDNRPSAATCTAGRCPSPTTSCGPM